MYSRGKCATSEGKGLKMLPTDMAGALYEDFDLNQSESSVRQVIRRWAQNLKEE